MLEEETKSPRTRRKSKTEPTGPYVHPEHVAKALGVPTRRVWRWCREGSIPCRTIANQYYIPRSFYDELVNGGV